MKSNSLVGGNVFRGVEDEEVVDRYEDWERFQDVICMSKDQVR